MNRWIRLMSAILLAAMLMSSAYAAEVAPMNSTYDRAKQLVADMSIEEKIGQVLLIDFRKWITAEQMESQRTTTEGEKNRDMFDSPRQKAEEPPQPSALTVLNDEIRGIIAQYRLDNIILFGENCGDTAALARLTYDYQAAARDAGLLPMLIGIDQEGGNITRLGSGTCLSGNMALGASGDSENAYLSGCVIGSELNALGIHCDFAPVVDVNRNPRNPVIGMRAFSDDPEIVTQMAMALAEGLRSCGVLSCAKHFPGHGDTDTDSHTGLPMVETSYQEWLKWDAVPFQRLAECAGVALVMTAHIQYPGLDDTKVVSAKDGQSIYLPATLSHRILTDVLKGELGFDGVVVTDALNMDAITEHFGQCDAAIKALAAGADMLCMPVTLRCMDDVAALDALYESILVALRDGTLSMERLDDAATRVVRLKLLGGILDDSENRDLAAMIHNAERIVGGEKNRAIERSVAAACVKIAYDGTFAPFAPQEGESIAVLMPYENELNSVKYAFNRMAREGTLAEQDVQYFCYNGLNAPDEAMLAALSEADYLIIGSEQTATAMRQPTHWLNTAVDEMLRQVGGGRVAILCEGLPYQQERFSQTYPCVMLYNYTGMSEADIDAEKFTGKYGPAIPAGIELLFGAA